MIRIVCYLILMFLLNNCAPTGSALLGPTFTAAKTGSIPQAALSYSSNKVMKNINKSINENIEKMKIEKAKTLKKIKNLHDKTLTKINENINKPIENHANIFFKTVKKDLKNNKIVSVN
jgi:predicted transcriptional regulator